MKDKRVRDQHAGHNVAKAAAPTAVDAAGDASVDAPEAAAAGATGAKAAAPEARTPDAGAPRSGGPDAGASAAEGSAGGAEGAWTFDRHHRVSGPKFSVEIPDGFVAMLDHAGHPFVSIARADYERARRRVLAGEPAGVDEMARIEYFPSTEEFDRRQVQGVERFALPEMLAESQRQARYLNDFALASAVDDWEADGANCPVMIFATRSEACPYRTFSVCPVGVSMPDTLVVFPAADESRDPDAYDAQALGLARALASTVELDEYVCLEVSSRIEACLSVPATPGQFRDAVHLARNGLLAYLPQRVRNDQARLAKRHPGDYVPKEARDRAALESLRRFEDVAARYYEEFVGMLVAQHSLAGLDDAGEADAGDDDAAADAGRVGAAPERSGDDGTRRPPEATDADATHRSAGAARTALTEADFASMCADVRASIRLVEGSLGEELGLDEEGSRELRAQVAVPERAVRAFALLETLDGGGPVLEGKAGAPQGPGEGRPGDADADAAPVEAAETAGDSEERREASPKSAGDDLGRTADGASETPADDEVTDGYAPSDDEMAPEAPVVEAEPHGEREGEGEVEAEAGLEATGDAEGEPAPTGEAAAPAAEGEPTPADDAGGSGAEDTPGSAGEAEGAGAEVGPDPAGELDDEAEGKTGTDEGAEQEPEPDAKAEVEAEVEAAKGRGAQQGSPAEDAPAEARPAPSSTAGSTEGAPASASAPLGDDATAPEAEEPGAARREPLEPAYLASSGAFNPDAACWLFCTDHVYFSVDDLVWDEGRHCIGGIHVNAATTDRIPRFMQDVRRNCALLIDLLREVEEDPRVHIPRDQVAAPVARALPPGDVSALSLFCLQACGRALMVRYAGDDSYDVVADQRVASGIPGFDRAMGWLVDDLRAASGAHAPFTIKFVTSLVAQADPYLSGDVPALAPSDRAPGAAAAAAPETAVTGGAPAEPAEDGCPVPGAGSPSPEATGATGVDSTEEVARNAAGDPSPAPGGDEKPRRRTESRARRGAAPEAVQAPADGVDDLGVLVELLGAEEVALVRRDRSAEPMTSRYFSARSEELVGAVLDACQRRLDDALKLTDQDERKRMADALVSDVNAAMLACVDAHLDVIEGKLADDRTSSCDPLDLQQMLDTTSHVLDLARQAVGAEAGRLPDAPGARHDAAALDQRARRRDDLARRVGEVREIPRNRYAERLGGLRSQAGKAVDAARRELEEAQSALAKAGAEDLESRHDRLADKVARLERAAGRHAWYAALPSSIARRRLYGANAELAQVRMRLSGGGLDDLRERVSKAQSSLEAAKREDDYLARRCS